MREMKKWGPWLLIVVSACFEVGWVTGLKHASRPWEWGLTIVAIAVSFYGLIAASARLPVGTVYAVFVGLGTAGTVLMEMLWFGEPFKPLKIALLLILLAAVIGLKLATPETAHKEGK